MVAAVVAAVVADVPTAAYRKEDVSVKTSTLPIALEFLNNLLGR